MGSTGSADVAKYDGRVFQATFDGPETGTKTIDLQQNGCRTSRLAHSSPSQGRGPSHHQRADCTAEPHRRC
jgi:hypothetical protein